MVRTRSMESNPQNGSDKPPAKKAVTKTTPKKVISKSNKKIAGSAKEATKSSSPGSTSASSRESSPVAQRGNGGSASEPQKKKPGKVAGSKVVDKTYLAQRPKPKATTADMNSSDSESDGEAPGPYKEMVAKAAPASTSMASMLPPLRRKAWPTSFRN